MKCLFRHAVMSIFLLLSWDSYAVDIKTCITDSPQKTFVVKSLDGLSRLNIKTGHPSADSCYSPGYVWMQVKTEGDYQWIQFVHFNKSAWPENINHGVTLFHSYQDWLFIDSIDHKLFMTNQPTNMHFDNPSANYLASWGKDEPLDWTAYTLAVYVDDQRKIITPKAAFTWGYTLPKNGKPSPKSVKRLKKSKLQKFITKYNIDKFIQDYFDMSLKT